MFDKAIKEVSSVHWKDSSFNSFPVVSVPVHVAIPNKVDYTEIYSTLKGPIRNIRQPDASYLKEFHFMMRHLDRPDFHEV